MARSKSKRRTKDIVSKDVPCANDGSDRAAADIDPIASPQEQEVHAPPKFDEKLGNNTKARSMNDVKNGTTNNDEESDDEPIGQTTTIDGDDDTDHFADNDDGSDDDDDGDDNDDDEVGTTRIQDSEKSGIDEEQDEEQLLDEPDLELTTGMANAMTKILGGASIPNKESRGDKRHQQQNPSAVTTSIVLSKTKTPLQIQAAKEEKARRDTLETRRLHREKRQLEALHIPLSVATSRIHHETTTMSSVAMELEQERTHRRVATRGIVVLFNAIAAHQVNPAQTAAAAAQVTAENKPGSNAKPSKLTKHGFLDLIKQTAAAKANATVSTGSTKDSQSLPEVSRKRQQQPAEKGGSKWNALKDDYMLDGASNWDEEDDDDDEMEEREPSKSTSPKKRHKARS